MNAALMAARAETMVLWYRGLGDEHGTLKPDTEIAMTLHALAPLEGWVDVGNPKGNAALVRRVRRWVDRQRSGEFAQYSFGTRRAGGGKTWSHLNTPEARLLSATIGTTTQVGSIMQNERAQAEYLGRSAMKFNAEAEEWFQLQDFQRSMICRDAANEVEQFGRIKPATKAALVRLGLL